MDAKVSESDIDRVYFFTEMGYDAEWFNQKAYATLLKFVSADPARVGVILDGVWNRLDRPEYLTKKFDKPEPGFSFWGKTRRGAKAWSKRIASERQTRWMLSEQLKLLKVRAEELRSNLPKAQIVLSLPSDDMQYSINALLHEAELLNGKRLENHLKRLKSDNKEIAERLKAAEKELAALKSDTDDFKAKKAEAEERIRQTRKELKAHDKRVTRSAQELTLWREKKTRPMLQYLRGRFMKAFFRITRALCRKLNIEVADRQKTLTFGNLRVDYAHSRHATWAPIKDIAKRMTNSVHGLEELLSSDASREFDRTIKRVEGQKPGARPDIIAASGHFGKGWKRLQKLGVNAAEMNFRNLGRHDPDILDEYVTLLLPLSFEDQARIGEFARGGYPERMMLSKPMSTKSHAAFQRLANGGASGLTIAWKGPDGIVETRWIQYQNFIDGSALENPTEEASIYITSDEHLGSAEEAPIARDGQLELYEREAVEPSSFWGRPLYARGFMSLGDTGEANSDRWQYKYSRKPDPARMPDSILELFAKTNSRDMASVAEAVMKLASYVGQGPVENAGDVLERVQKYYWDRLQITLRHSRLKIAHASVTGNHFDENMRSKGIPEHAYFRVVCEHAKIPVYAAGDSVREIEQADPWRDARVALGGYSTARTLLIPDYGMNVDGAPSFGPVRTVLHHDPKGGGLKGLIGTGKTAQAHLSLAGHTHEVECETWSRGDNIWGLAYRCGTMQGETSTGIQYADTPPRTPAAHRIIPRRPGDFAERAMPLPYLQKVGREALLRRVEAALAGAGSPKTPG